MCFQPWWALQGENGSPWGIDHSNRSFWDKKNPAIMLNNSKEIFLVDTVKKHKSGNTWSQVRSKILSETRLLDVLRE